MLIFGYLFHFVHEKQLKDIFYVPESVSNTETIKVVKSEESSLDKRFSMHTLWMPMSGQEVRYWSNAEFKEADENFSWALEVKDVLTLIWEAKENKIRYIKYQGYASMRLAFWVFHTFFPLVLELKRTYRILHVGSVEVEGKPILFSAVSFGGKSTLTDFFIQKGHTLFSDDAVGVKQCSDGYCLTPSYPYHRPHREPEDLGYYVENFATKPKPIHAVYLLEKSAPDATIQIVELFGIEKFKAFHYSAFIDFDFMKHERFDFFIQMAKQVRVYTISVPWDIQRLPEVYETIVSDARNS